MEREKIWGYQKQGFGGGGGGNASEGGQRVQISCYKINKYNRTTTVNIAISENWKL